MCEIGIKRKEFGRSACLFGVWKNRSLVCFFFFSSVDVIGVPFSMRQA